MNKTELASAVSEKTGLTKKDSEAAINAVFESIGEALETGDRIQLTGFGVFDVKVRDEHTARNPRTGEEIIVPLSRIPRFRPGKTLRELIDEN